MVFFLLLSGHQGFYYFSTLGQVITVKGALLDLRQFLATESPLKMMKNAFYFTLKTRFVLKIFQFLS